MRARAAIVAWVLLLGAVPAARAAGTPRLPDLRLVPLQDGLREVSPDDDLARAAESQVGKLAAAVGLDLTKTANPLLAATFADGRLFYVFYKTTANAFGDRPYLIQRIKKTERTWKKAGDAKPEEEVSYQVEVYKLHGGGLKQADQHHGSFSLKDAHRREVVKEYEIGFGEIPGVAEGVRWPFPGEILFKLTQPYQPDVGHHDAVKFTAARKWTLTVAFERGGAWNVTSPELGFDAPKKWPDPAAAAPTPDPASKSVVLEPGVGLAGVRVGESRVADLEKALGAPLEDVEAGKKHRLLSFERSLTCNLDPEGRLKSILTRPGFLGATQQGVSHGTTRADVMAKMGSPKTQKADAQDWTYPGLVVRFDALDKVVRLVVHADR